MEKTVSKINKFFSTLKDDQGNTPEPTQVAIMFQQYTDSYIKMHNYKKCQCKNNH